MNVNTQLATNPLLFGYARDEDGTVAFQGLEPARIPVLSGTAVEIAEHFLEPHTLEAGLAAGFELEDLERACQLGVVVPVGSPGYGAARVWEERGWSRAAFLVTSQFDVHGSEHGEEGSCPPPWRRPSVGRAALPAVDVTSPISIDALVRRRTLRSFGDRPMDLRALSEIFLRLDRTSSWLDVLVVVQSVDGLDRGVYRYEPVGHQLDLIRLGVDDAEILAAVNSQPWVVGSGACAFLVVQWDRYSWLHRQSRAYIDLLVHVGEFAQEMLHAVYHVGAGAWGSPALHETAARNLLGIERGGIDALYAVKFGPAPD